MKITCTQILSGELMFTSYRKKSDSLKTFVNIPTNANPS